MWMMLFAVTFAIAISLNLAALITIRRHLNDGAAEAPDVNRKCRRSLPGGGLSRSMKVGAIAALGVLIVLPVQAAQRHSPNASPVITCDNDGHCTTFSAAALVASNRTIQRKTPTTTAVATAPATTTTTASKAVVTTTATTAPATMTTTATETLATTTAAPAPATTTPATSETVATTTASTAPATTTPAPPDTGATTPLHTSPENTAPARAHHV